MASQLRLIAGCQIGGEDGDVDGGLVGGAVDFASGVVLGDGALDDAGADAQPPVGHQAGQDEAADPAGEVDAGAGDDARGQGDLVAGGVQGDGEAGPVGVGARDGAGGVGDGGAEGLVGDEQGVDLLLDAVGGAGAQDAAAEDRGLQLAEVTGRKPRSPATATTRVMTDLSNSGAPWSEDVLADKPNLPEEPPLLAVTSTSTEAP
jgi:hypothetical protein